MNYYVLSLDGELKHTFDIHNNQIKIWTYYTSGGIVANGSRLIKNNKIIWEDHKDECHNLSQEAKEYMEKILKLMVFS